MNVPFCKSSIVVLSYSANAHQITLRLILVYSRNDVLHFARLKNFLLRPNFVFYFRL